MQHDPRVLGARLRRDYDDLEAGQFGGDVVVSPATAAELAAMHARIVERLGVPVADLAVSERIRALRPDNIWAIRTAAERWPAEGPSGLYAMIMLTEAGAAALLAGRFNAADPAPAHCAGPGAPVAAIYKWLIFAPGRAAAAIPEIAAILQQPAYARADILGSGSTLKGRRIMASLGFEVVRDGAAPLYQYVRRSNRT